MGLKPDHWIRKMSLEHGMIEPFADSQIRPGVISYGLTSYGYDVRIADEYKIPHSANISYIDPKATQPENFIDYTGEFYTIPPNSYILGRSVEYFRIPRNVLTLCFGKSTYARSGILVNVTPFEPEWEGYVTISISNTAPLPTRIYSNEGIAQIIFLEADSECEVSYADKKGKYQKQEKIIPSKL